MIRQRLCLGVVLGVLFAWSSAVRADSFIGAVLSGAQAVPFLNQRIYFNLHTDVFPGSAVRGQRIQNLSEPSTLTLLVIGRVGLAATG